MSPSIVARGAMRRTDRIHNTADAHEIVGNRFFPATLAIDDPGVNDELAFRPS
jgi:hypothetical protein